MREILSKIDYVDDIAIETFETEITDACITKFKAGTTGYKGGDSGHGCRTVLEIEDLASTDMRVDVLDENDNILFENDYANKIKISFGGDAELSNVIEGLKFMIQVLEDQKDEG
jgi:hypothetical protein